ncbi:MAG: hypothetical protein J6B64_01610 [Bacilli bacterium]|nr:hypothetical protein [Bacilli bacterium]MBP3921252.1 hypothetical protein [Bacilli bacterium]
MNQEFNYKANIYHRMDITVIAEDKENADRILNDTINSIEDQYKYLFEQSENVKVNDTKSTHQFYLSDREKEVER